MLIPNTFAQTTTSELFTLIQQFPFATLITSHKTQGIVADHLPLVLEMRGEQAYLIGHIAKANPMWKATVTEGAIDNVLVTFNGPHGYISPQFYPSKKRDGKAVPTWNYVVVQVRGTLCFVHEQQWKLTMLDTLSDKHESETDAPWQVSDAPDEYINTLIQGIVGIEIEVTDIKGQWKLSQNQSNDNYAGVINGLEKRAASISLLPEHTDDLIHRANDMALVNYMRSLKNSKHHGE